MSQTRIGRTTGIRAGRLRTGFPGFSGFVELKTHFTARRLLFSVYNCLASWARWRLRHDVIRANSAEQHDSIKDERGRWNCDKRARILLHGPIKNEKAGANLATCSDFSDSMALPPSLLSAHPAIRRQKQNTPYAERQRRSGSGQSSFIDGCRWSVFSEP